MFAASKVYRFLILRQVSPTGALPEILQIFRRCEEEFVSSPLYRWSFLEAFPALQWNAPVDSRRALGKPVSVGERSIPTLGGLRAEKQINSFVQNAKKNQNQALGNYLKGGGTDAIFLTLEQEVILT